MVQLRCDFGISVTGNAQAGCSGKGKQQHPPQRRRRQHNIIILSTENTEAEAYTEAGGQEQPTHASGRPRGQLERGRF